MGPERRLDKTVLSRIADYILTTKTHDAPTSIDGQLMLDIDLSILGTLAHIYDEFETHIRREYRRVPRFVFRNFFCYRYSYDSIIDFTCNRSF